MDRLVEAIRRLLVIAVWVPPLIILFAGIVDSNNLADFIKKGVLYVCAGTSVLSFILHKIINWIFQYKKKIIEVTPEDYPMHPELFMERHNFKLYCLGMCWFMLCVSYGRSQNGLKVIDFDMMLSLEQSFESFSLTWPYMIAGFVGFILLFVIVEHGYRIYLRAKGYPF